jgi:hypothetical protein
MDCVGGVGGGGERGEVIKVRWFRMKIAENTSECA